MAGSNLSGYISDGTFAGHMLAQNPQDAGCMGRQGDLARYAGRDGQLQPPALAVGPDAGTCAATWLAGNAAGWKHLDAASVTYSGSSGDAAAWVRSQAGAAGRARLGLLVGMNVLNGGTSPSKLAGTSKGKWR